MHGLVTHGNHLLISWILIEGLHCFVAVCLRSCCDDANHFIYGGENLRYQYLGLCRLAQQEEEEKRLLEKVRAAEEAQQRRQAELAEAVEKRKAEETVKEAERQATIRRAELQSSKRIRELEVWLLVIITISYHNGHCISCMLS